MLSKTMGLNKQVKDVNDTAVTHFKTHFQKQQKRYFGYWILNI